MNCPGMLVYPKDDRDVDATYSARGVEIAVAAVDLSTAGLRGLAELACRVQDRLALGSEPALPVNSESPRLIRYIRTVTHPDQTRNLARGRRK